MAWAGSVLAVRSVHDLVATRHRRRDSARVRSQHCSVDAAADQRRAHVADMVEGRAGEVRFNRRLQDLLDGLAAKNGKLGERHLGLP